MTVGAGPRRERIALGEQRCIGASRASNGRPDAPVRRTPNVHLPETLLRGAAKEGKRPVPPTLRVACGFGSQQLAGQTVAGTADMLGKQHRSELEKPVVRVGEHGEDHLPVGDAQSDSFVACGVGDEQEGGGVVVAGVGEEVYELQDGGARDVDSRELHAAEASRGVWV